MSPFLGEEESSCKDRQDENGGRVQVTIATTRVDTEGFAQYGSHYHLVRPYKARERTGGLTP